MSTAEAKKTAEKKVLHVGCGLYRPDRLHASFRENGYKEVRLDISKDVKPDILADMRDMPMIENDGFDGIFSSHNLEHVFAHEVPIVLKEFCRVLKKGGHALITMPDIEKVAEHIVKNGLEAPLYNSPMGPICPIDILYGHRGAIAKGRIYMAHKTAFTKETLHKKLEEAGFSRIQVTQGGGFDLWAVAYK